MAYQIFVDKVIGVDLNYDTVQVSDGRVFKIPHFNKLLKISEMKKELKNLPKGSVVYNNLNFEIAKRCLTANRLRDECIDNIVKKILQPGVQGLIIESLSVSEFYKKDNSSLIKDAGFSLFIRSFYNYVKENNITIRKISSYDPSSQICSKCGYKNAGLDASKYWTCPTCGTYHQRDENAALNIKRMGLSMLKTETNYIIEDNIKIFPCTTEKPKNDFVNCKFSINANDGKIIAFTQEFQKELFEKIINIYNLKTENDYCFFKNRKLLDALKIIGYEIVDGKISQNDLVNSASNEIRFLISDLGYEIKYYVSPGTTAFPRNYFIE